MDNDKFTLAARINGQLVLIKQVISNIKGNLGEFTVPKQLSYLVQCALEAEQTRLKKEFEDL